MTFSPLISGTVPYYNKFHSRQSQPIVRVLQHHHAASSNAGVDRLTNPTQPASSNYIIMSTGEILGQVPEEYRAWTSGSFEADAPSITIEVQNSGGQANGNDSDPASWPINDAAYNAIVNLVADVAKRYGWSGVTEGNYRGHREFSQTACPGGYIWARMSTIRAAANALLNGSGIQPQGSTTPKEWDEMASKEEIFEAVWGGPGVPLIHNNELGRGEYPKTILGSLTDRIVRQQITPLRQEVAAQNAQIANLISALANVSNGEPFDEAKLLAGVQSAAEAGVKSAIESIDTTITIKEG